MSLKLQETRDAEGGSRVQSVPLNPKLTLSKEERLKFLSRSNLLYAKNQYVKFEGKWLRFEPPQYHLGMANLFRNRAKTIA